MPDERRDPNAGANKPRDFRFQDGQDRMPPRQKPGFITAPDPRMPAMTSQIKVTNRAEKGALKGKGCFLTYNGIQYPENVNPLDESTWIKPGDVVFIDKEIIVGNFGYIFAPDPVSGKLYTEAGRDNVLNRFGGWEYNGTQREHISQRSMTSSNSIVGPPLFLPDLLLVQINSRGKEVGQTVSIFDEVERNQSYQRRTVDKDGYPILIKATK
jgi:hypothetical protein